MVHHLLDDAVVRPSGCCDGSRLPTCRGGSRSNYCVSVLQFFDLWATQVNACGGDATGDATVAGGGDPGYSLSYSGGSETSRNETIDAPISNNSEVLEPSNPSGIVPSPAMPEAAMKRNETSDNSISSNLGVSERFNNIIEPGDVRVCNETK